MLKRLQELGAQDHNPENRLLMRRFIEQNVSSFIQEAVEGLDTSQIKGIGFDATCSLVAMDTNFQPITVSTGGERMVGIFLIIHKYQWNSAVGIHILFLFRYVIRNFLIIRLSK